VAARGAVLKAGGLVAPDERGILLGTAGCLAPAPAAIAVVLASV